MIFYKNPNRVESPVYESEYQRLNRLPQIEQDYSKFLEKVKMEKAPKTPDLPYLGNNNNWFDNTNENFIVEEEDEQKTEQKAKQEQPKNPPQLTELKSNQFCLLLQNQILAISDSQELISNLIEEILFNGDPKYNSVTVEDLFLIKRLPIKVGVQIG